MILSSITISLIIFLKTSKFCLHSLEGVAVRSSITTLITKHVSSETVVELFALTSLNLFPNLDWFYPGQCCVYIYAS